VARPHTAWSHLRAPHPIAPRLELWHGHTLLGLTSVLLLPSCMHAMAEELHSLHSLQGPSVGPPAPVTSNNGTRSAGGNTQTSTIDINEAAAAAEDQGLVPPNDVVDFITDMSSWLLLQQQQQQQQQQSRNSSSSRGKAGGAGHYVSASHAAASAKQVCDTGMCLQQQAIEWGLLSVAACVAYSLPRSASPAAPSAVTPVNRWGLWRAALCSTVRGLGGRGDVGRELEHTDSGQAADASRARARILPSMSEAGYLAWAAQYTCNMLAVRFNILLLGCFVGVMR